MTQLSLREIALILRVPVPLQFEDMADEKFKAIDSVMAVMKKGSIFFMRVMYQGHVPNADEIMKRGAKFLVKKKIPRLGGIFSELSNDLKSKHDYKTCGKSVER